MRETYRVEYRIAVEDRIAADRWYAWYSYADGQTAFEWARRLAADGKTPQGLRVVAARVVTVTEQYEIVHPPKEATDA